LDFSWGENCRFNDTGFTVNGVEYEGSLLCVGNLIMSWKPKKFSEITADRFVSSFLPSFIPSLFYI
jgi:NADH dehydrogenase [ubiquinone] 1 alpha subcomplex assembly factor 3